MSKKKNKSVYDRTVYNIGYIGNGRYSPNTNRKIYSIWVDMIKRCYDKKEHTRYPKYTECEVSDDWLNFQNFAKWFDDNYYNVEGYKMHLDKDILIKGNKLYSSETCIFVPSNINVLFVKADSSRGNLPLGVSMDKGRYKASCRYNGKQKTIGRFDSENDAFEAYKLFKENVIKKIAIEFKDKIPKKLYDAMISYSVDIND